MRVSEHIFGPSYDPYANLQMLSFNGHGWASQSIALEQTINKFQPKLIVEIGTWMGGSARFMTKLAKVHHDDVEVVCVDTFLGSVEHWTKESYLMTLKNGRPTIYEQFLSNNIHQGLQGNITPWPIDSINAFETLKKWDVHPEMIYLDAAHDYASVKADLERWITLLAPGGVLVGDDFHHEPIIRAVGDVLIPIAPIEELDNKYIWNKP